MYCILSDRTDIFCKNGSSITEAVSSAPLPFSWLPVAAVLFIYFMKSSEVDERALNLMIIFSFRACPGYYYNIYSTSEMLFGQSVTLSDKPRQAVSYNTVPNFFTYRDSQPVFLQPVIHHIHYQITVGKRFSIIINFLKISVFL